MDGLQGLLRAERRELRSQRHDRRGLPGGLIELADGGGSQSAGEDRDFIKLAFPIGETIDPAAEAKLLQIRRTGEGERAFQVRHGPAIKVHPDVGSFAHQHDVMPRFQGQGGFTGEQLIGFVAIEKNQPALGSRQMGAADAEVFARRGGVAVPPAGIGITGHGPGVRGHAVP